MAPSFGFVANSKMLSPSNNEGEMRQEAAVSPGEAGDTAIKPIPWQKGTCKKEEVVHGRRTNRNFGVLYVLNSEKSGVG